MGHEVEIHCDIVHPASGEALAEAGETLKASNPRALRVLALVVDYPECFSHQREGETTHISEYKLEGCPTDEEIHLAALMADKARLETWYEEHWKAPDNHKWSEGRGYGNFPKEGL